MSAKTITKRMLKNAKKLKVFQDKAKAGTLTVAEAMVLASLQPEQTEPQVEPVVTQPA